MQSAYPRGTLAATLSALSDLETYDPTPGNNFATDTDFVVLFRADFELH